MKVSDYLLAPEVLAIFIWVIGMGCHVDSSEQSSRQTNVTDTASTTSQNYCLYLVALADKGEHGQGFGCDDSLVPVSFSVQKDQTLTLPGVLSRQLTMEKEFYSFSEAFEGKLYNTFYRSELSVDTVLLKPGRVVVRLSGSLRMGGMCDRPRIRQQLEGVLRQPGCSGSPVGREGELKIQVNGEPLEAVLSTR